MFKKFWEWLKSIFQPAPAPQPQPTPVDTKPAEPQPSPVPTPAPTPQPEPIPPKQAPPTQLEAWTAQALEITGHYEGHGWDEVTGDFDQMGLSCGILQWNFGTGSLQERILKPYIALFGSIDALGIFPGPVDVTSTLTAKQALVYVRNKWLDSKGNPLPQWKAAWVKFLSTDHCKTIQSQAAKGVALSAMKECEAWGMVSKRAFCFFFDINTQNGSIGSIKKPSVNRSITKSYIAEATAKNQALWGSVEQTDEMNILFQAAYLRARQSRSQYFQDVFSRKGAIALGVGYVHGQTFHYNF